MKNERRPRVCLAPFEIAGYYAQLQAGFEAIGCRVIRLSVQSDSRQYAAPPEFWPNELARKLTQAASRSSNKLWRRVLSKCASVTLLVLAIRAIASSDFLIYGFGSTISWYPKLELKFARWLGRRVVFIFHGSDSRPPYFGPLLLSPESGVSVSALREMVIERYANVRWCDAVADEVIDSPFSSHFHGRTCVNWHAIGIPYSNTPAVPPPPPQGERVRVLHSPSHPEGKGTPLIRDAIATLKLRGFPIDYVEVIGRPNEEVLSEIARSDLVVDQAYSDVPMAGFATEAAAFGRPAVVGSLASAHFAQFIATADMPPVYVCHPNDLEVSIERLVSDRALREELGRTAHAFVQQHRSAPAVAARLLRVVHGDFPSGWRFDPRTVLYGGGSGPPLASRKMITSLVSEFGTSSLELDDYPEVREVVLATIAGPEAADVSALPAS